jgi:four helix bundle protein
MRVKASQERKNIVSLLNAVISVPSNIAEGQARATSRDFANFLVVAKGSLAEIDTQLTIAVRRRYVANGTAEEIYLLIGEISKMIVALRSRVVGKNHRH